MKNERIEKLLKKAQKITAENHVPGGRDYEREIYLEFAELIVQDCLGVLKRRFMGDLNREDMEVKRCIEDVKKHFGVEE